MNSEAELLQKLMISKKIMEKHNDMGRGQSRNISMNNESYSSPILEDFEAPSAKYNIPQEFMEEQRSFRPSNSNTSIEDRIASSRLPDEIKKLMIEHPIQQPSMGMASGAKLSDELVEKASRLMNTKPKQNTISESNTSRQTKTTNFDVDNIRSIIKETVEEVLQENGLLIESETKTSDMFKFRVGQHIFEGKVTKIKKLSR